MPNSLCARTPLLQLWAASLLNVLSLLITILSHTHMPCSFLAGDGDTGLSAVADT